MNEYDVNVLAEVFRALAQMLVDFIRAIIGKKSGPPPLNV